MLTEEQNERLTRVGPGTPMGALMRRYWQPIAAVAELEEEPTKEVKLLGEELVLYKNRRGGYGLIGRRCAHRRVNLLYGVPEDDGLRCPYHGWKYDGTGQCIEQPFEDTVHPDGRFKEKIAIPGYPVEELGGLIFAYLGPKPAPLLPRWGLLVMDRNVLREMFITEVPCNWLQCMENSVDPVHIEWLHGYYGSYLQDRLGREDAESQGVRKLGTHQKIGFERFDRGIIKRRMWSGGSENDDSWKVGHPVLFPNILQQGRGGRYFLQYRVPIDDTHTWHVEYAVYVLPPEVEAPRQDSIPITYPTVFDERGRLRADDVLAQDHLAWVTQGPIMDRSQEKLGESDTGVIMYRQMLQEQMAVVEDGGDPVNVIRDPAQNRYLMPPQESWGTLDLSADTWASRRWGANLDDQLIELMQKAKTAVTG